MTGTGLLPGRPPDGPEHGPRPGERTRAVCCSGGGIRAAAFALGGLQRLGRRDGSGRSWYDGVDLVTAVSGGSYLAASYAMVNHSPPPGGFGDVPVYAPGSPEDNRLRAHTRYLVEDRSAAAVGVLGIAYGLVLNLLPVLAGLFVLGTVLGWALRWLGIVELDPSGTAWRTVELSSTVTAIAVCAAGALLLFTADRWVEVHRPDRRRSGHGLRTWCLRLLGAALLALVLLVGVPVLLRVIVDAGTPGRITTVPLTHLTTGVVGACGALLALVKATLGRFGSRLQATTSPPTTSRAATLLGRAGRATAPWLGSLLAAGLLVGAFLAWVNNAAYRGATAAGWLWCVLAVAGIALWQLGTDINRSSIHPFYKARLSTAFAVRRTAEGTAEQQEPGEALRFSAYAGDRPTLVVCAAVNTDQPGVVPAGRGCAPFTFSPHWTGISAGTMFRDGPGRAPVTHEPGDGVDAAGRVAPPSRMLPTTVYERLTGPHLLDLPAAVAVSGAAVSPVMGRMSRAPLRLLLGLCNVRLGLWLPNPLDPRSARLEPGPDRAERTLRQRLAAQWRQPGLRALLAEILGGIRLDGRWVYVTDGGHYENLGLVEALRRGATEVLVLDASGDPPNSWSAFGQAVETARTDLGVEVVLDPSQVMAPRDPDGFAPTLAAAGAFRYPNGVEGTLWLCKLAMAEEVSWDVHAWLRAHPDFPHTSTAQQLYGDREFEAYRRLGEAAAEMALRLMVAEGGAPVPQQVDLTGPVTPVRA